MLHLFSILLLALSANVDNLAVAMAYGFKRLRIGLGTNLFIAFVSATATFLSMSVGEDLESYFSIAVANALGSALLVGVGLWMMGDVVKRARKRRRQTAVIKQERVLAAVGASASVGSGPPLAAPPASPNPNEEFRELLQEFSYEHYLENPEKADQDRSGYIDVRESIALAFGLSLNNLGAGVGAGISNLDVGLTTGLVFGLSVLAFLVGDRLGDRFAHQLSRFWHRSGLWAGLVSGGLIVMAGIYEYFVV